MFSFAGDSFITSFLKIKQHPQHPSNKKNACVLKKKKKKRIRVGEPSPKLKKKKNFFLVDDWSIEEERDQGRSSSRCPEELTGAPVPAWLGDCAEAAQGDCCAVGDPVLYLLFLSFVVPPY